ncbi:MATE efflux family protein FRD3 [Spatholobus suberectus]|nr:MATE efflux family protein FRD3 [Spatholobus suberectus]
MDENGSSNNAPKNKRKLPLLIFFKDARLVFKMDSLAKEILGIAFPSALAVAADPVASLIDTAFIGHLGPVELAAAGVSIALFNQASKITIFPLVSITTSFVAEEDTIEKMKKTAAENHSNENNMAKSNEVAPQDHLLQDIENSATKEYGKIPMKSLVANSANANMCMFSSVASSGEKSVSKVGRKKRQIASASTALLFGTILGLIQTAILIFAAKPLLSLMGQKHNSPTQILAVKYLRLRALGAPAVLLSLAMQGIFRGFKDTKTPLYVIVLGYSLNIALEPILIFRCKLGINGAAISHVFSQYIMALALLLILMTRVVLQPPRFKDLQIFRFLKNGGMLFAKVVALTFCVTLASSVAARLGPIPMAAFQTCLQVWLATSLLADGLAVAVQFVAATQPINSLAFVFDGVNYGASDFAYSAYSMVMVSLATIAYLFVLYKSKGFIGIWIALSIHMSLRMFAGIWR